jgi:hypothetical protein
MIRLEGAEVLCNSLRTNRILTNLDLSYNALGSAAAGVLGAALMENSVSRPCSVVTAVGFSASVFCTLYPVAATVAVLTLRRPVALNFGAP